MLKYIYIYLPLVLFLCRTLTNILIFPNSTHTSKNYNNYIIYKRGYFSMAAAVLTKSVWKEMCFIFLIH